jgi:flagella synthesis protein FlgN
MNQANELLDQQAEQLTSLGDLLQAELDAYKQRNTDKILDTAEAKQALLIKIQALDQSIAQLENLDELKQNESFQARVDAINHQLKEIKVQSTINERVIRTSLNNVTRLKQSILSLKNADSMTYDKQGQAKTQTLGKGIKA